MAVSFDDFAHHKITVDGLQLHYRSAGEGEAVVLLHGWPQHSLQWHAVAPALAERYRVIVPDLIGFGRSDKLADRSVPARHDAPLRASRYL